MKKQFDFRALQVQLHSKKLNTLYLLAGDEAYLVDQSIQMIRTQALGDGPKDFNYDLIYAGEKSASQIRDIVETLPMMAQFRVIVLKAAENLKAKDWDVLLPLLQNPVDTSVFVLAFEAVDKRKKYFKAAQESGVTVELKRPYENQVPAWIDYIGQMIGVRIEKEARLLLAQFVGQNLYEIHNELLKLKEYTKSEKDIQAEDVLKVVSKSKVHTIFDLTNAIGRRDRAGALVQLANLLEHGQNEIGVVAMISRHLRILGKVRRGSGLGLSGQKLSTQAGIPHFYLREYQTQAQRWGERKITRAMDVLYETDRALKSSPASSHIWLENLVIQACES